MSRVDRAVRRTRQHLDQDEALLATAWGFEDEGRRARVVVVTDRRVVVGWRRPAPPDVLAAATTATFDATTRSLSLTDGAGTVRLRDVDPQDAQQVVALLHHRPDRPLAERLGSPNHVRIVEG